jgi:glycosyltransferase involved in cell wall biosynthesis
VRVLLIAEAANPEWTSVPLVGWSHCRAIAELTDVHVATQIRNREAFIRAGLREGADFTAIDSEAVARPLFKIGSVFGGKVGKGWTSIMASSALAYYYFEHRVWKQFAKPLRQGEYDLVHRVTPLSPTVPSIAARKIRRAGVPFVVGPLNGGVPWPRHFDRVRRAEWEYLSYVRGLYRLLPAYRSTRRNAAALIVGSEATHSQVPRAFHSKCVYIPENAIDPSSFSEPVDRPVGTPLRVAFVGRLVPYKGADMLIEAAIPLLRTGRLALDIIGDGPEMPKLKALVEKEDVADSARLAGWVEHGKLQDRLAQSDVFGFPSIREFGGGVVLEAMALGLVPVVVGYAGPRELVTDATGYRIPIGDRASIVEQMRRILSTLAENPETIRPMGARARQRVLRWFTWQAKAKQTVEVYRWVLGERDDKPDFGMPLPDDPVGI